MNTHSEAQPAEPPEIWSAGLPYTGERDLTQTELAELSEQICGLTWKGQRLLLSAPLLVTAVYVGLWAATTCGVDLMPSQRFGWMMLSILWGLIAIAWGALQIQRGRWLQKDLQVGRADHFKGVLAPFHSPDAMDRIMVVGNQNLTGSLRQLVTLGLLRDDHSAPQTLDVLRHARMVWKVNGNRPKQWILPVTSSPIRPPAHAAIAAQWLDPKRLSDGTTVELGKRELSGPEREFLTRLARTCTLGALGGAALLDLFLALRIWLLMTGQDHLTGSEGSVAPGAFLLWQTLLTIAANVVLPRCVSFGIKLRKDLRRGHVLIARFPMSPEEAAAWSAPAADGYSPPMEFLVEARTLWSYDGRPASWRSSSGDRYMLSPQPPSGSQR